MDASLLLYNLAAGAAAACLPPVWLAAKLAGRWPELWPRVGLYRHLAPARTNLLAGPRVWLQAVSVGEVSVAAAIADELFRQVPGLNLTITTSTAKGLEKALEVFADRAAVAAFPLDLPWSVMTAAAKIRPQVYASLETEIWPNLLAWLDRQGASLLMLNGRLSPRSFPRYQKLSWLVRPALKRFNRLSMITTLDAQRALALGADPARVSVEGNAKYAGLMERAKPDAARALEARLALKGAPLLVAGSVRSGEEEPVISAFARVLQNHPQAVLAVAPRHVEKSPRWMEMCTRLGLSAQLWSALRDDAPRKAGTRVVVVDAMGVLMPLYGLGRAAFLGASLVPLGGQNPMEPAAWGVPVCYGQSMEDFQDAVQALEAVGAGARVKSSEELAIFWKRCLSNPDQANKIGQTATQVVRRWSGSAQAAAGLILRQLEARGAL
jgi:3-deoxy-D-manno-octulosonic-acid transferase